MTGQGNGRTPGGAAARALALAGALALAAAADGAPAQSGAGASPQAGTGSVTKLPLPRYVSLGAGQVNVRRGPGLEYRRDWLYEQAGLPVRVVDEYEHWRLIEDSEGVGGWVYHALISGRRTVLVTGQGVLLHRRAGGEAGPVDCAALSALPEEAVACAVRGAVARLRECGPDWCEIEADGLRGWVPKTALWGVDAGEIVER